MFTLRAGIAQWYSSGLQLGWSGVRVPAGAGNFLFTTTCRPALGPTQLHIKWVTEALSLGVKRPGRQADHSSLHLAPSSRKRGAITPLPNTPSRRCAQSNHVGYFTYTLFYLYLSCISCFHPMFITDTTLLVFIFGCPRHADWSIFSLSPTYVAVDGCPGSTSYTLLRSALNRSTYS
jgi:hypothetical protein